MTDDSSTSCNIEENKLQELAEAWSRMVDCVSHDLTSPLVSTRLMNENLANMLPNLIEGYEISCKNNLITSKVNEKRLKGLKIIGSDLTRDIDSILVFLSSLYLFTQELVLNSKSNANISAQAYFDEIINEYFSSHKIERELLHVNYQHDFNLNCVPFFVKYLLLNLLSNAVSAIHHAKKGEIFLRTEKKDDFNLVFFKDTALGMDQEKLSHIFNRFFSKRKGEIVPGLGFCRLALLQNRGDIICNSIKGEFTEFVIKFPILNQ